MSIASPSKLHLIVPDYPLDQIIGYFTGSIAVGHGGSPSFASVALPHGFGDSCYFQGVFSSDGGTTWNDFGAEIPTPGSPLPTFQTVGCNASVDTVNVNVYGINWTGSNVTVMYKLYLIAKNTMAQPITPIPTTQKLSFSSVFNFQQIAYKETASLSVASGATGSTSFIHNLGYVPIVRVYCATTGTPTTILPIIYDADPSSSFISSLEGGLSSTQVQLTATTLTLFIDNSSAFSGGTISLDYEYRIYL